MDGLELLQKDNTNYHLDYKPIFTAPTVGQGISNAASDIMSLAWNISLGSIYQGGQKINNYFAGGYKEKQSGGNTVDNFMNATNEMYKYHKNTPAQQQIKDFASAATNLNNYEGAVQLLLLKEFGSELYVGEAAGTLKATTTKEFFTKVTQNVEEHVSTKIFLNDAGVIRADNQVMINRIKKIADGELMMTQVDKDYIDHELTESSLMKNNPEMSYEGAHRKALEIHGIPYDKNTSKRLYTQEALDAGDAEYRKEDAEKSKQTISKQKN